DQFRPDVAVLLNVTPDHLDRHGSFAAYLEAKGRMFVRQTAADLAVVHDEPRLLAEARRGGARVVAFGVGAKASSVDTDAAGACPFSIRAIASGFAVPTTRSTSRQRSRRSPRSRCPPR